MKDNLLYMSIETPKVEEKLEHNMEIQKLFDSARRRENSVDDLRREHLVIEPNIVNT